MKQKRFRISTDVIVLSAFAVLAVSLVWNTTEAIMRNYELQQQVDELTAEIAVLEVENQNLRYNISYYQTDTFLELEAREKFNKALPGEKLVLLEKNTQPPSANDSAQAETEEPKTNFESWLEYLSGKIVGGS